MCFHVYLVYCVWVKSFTQTRVTRIILPTSGTHPVLYIYNGLEQLLLASFSISHQIYRRVLILCYTKFIVIFLHFAIL